jgi:hypothetical protein
MITHYWPHDYYPQRNIRRPEVVELGLFYVGEIPPALVHQFLDYDFLDPAFDWAVEFFVTGPDDLTGTPVFTGGGEVTYTWLTEDMTTPGTYEGRFVVEDDPLHNRMASSLFRWRVV